jgi:hypothetical protein
MATRNSFGALGFTENPIICGGTDKDNQTRKNCYSLKSNTWIEYSGFDHDKYFICELFQKASSFIHKSIRLT